MPTQVIFLAIVPRRIQDAITDALQKVTSPIHSVVSDYSPAMNAIRAVYQLRFIDRCLARKPEQLTDETYMCCTVGLLTYKTYYQALNHMRYLLI